LNWLTSLRTNTKQKRIDKYDNSEIYKVSFKSCKSAYTVPTGRSLKQETFNTSETAGTTDASQILLNTCGKLDTNMTQ